MYVCVNTKVRCKFNPMKAVVAGRIVVLVDDSIVRGTTAKQLISLMKSAGISHLFDSLIRNAQKKKQLRLSASDAWCLVMCLRVLFYSVSAS